MTKPALALLCLTIIIYSCNNQTTENKTTVEKTSIAQDTTIFKGLHGTWIRQNKQDFTLIEIKDMTNVLYYQFIDRKAGNDTTTTDRYWYYKSNAKMGYWSSDAI